MRFISPLSKFFGATTRYDQKFPRNDHPFVAPGRSLQGAPCLLKGPSFVSRTDFSNVNVWFFRRTRSGGAGTWKAGRNAETRFSASSS